MNPIAEYLRDTGMTQVVFAKGIDVSQSMVHQYITDVRPVSEKVCVRIELFTDGRLSRKTLRPSDWPQIWPELQEASHA